MPLIILHLGEKFTRFDTENDARLAGAIRHTEGQPARIEITPDGGGPMVTMEYDRCVGEWMLAT